MSQNACFTLRASNTGLSAAKLRLTNIPQAPAWKQITAPTLCMLGAKSPTGPNVLLDSAEQTGRKQTVQSTTQTELTVVRENVVALEIQRE